MYGFQPIAVPFPLKNCLHVDKLGKTSWSSNEMIYATGSSAILQVCINLF